MWLKIDSCCAEDVSEDHIYLRRTLSACDYHLPVLLSCCRRLVISLHYALQIMYVNLLDAYKILWFVTIVERGYVDSILAFHVYSWSKNGGYGLADWTQVILIVFMVLSDLSEWRFAIFCVQFALAEISCMTPKKCPQHSCISIVEIFSSTKQISIWDVFGINKIWCRSFFCTNVQEL